LRFSKNVPADLPRFGGTVLVQDFGYGASDRFGARPLAPGLCLSARRGDHCRLSPGTNGCMAAANAKPVLNGVAKVPFRGSLKSAGSPCLISVGSVAA
jgi:hypothetical protein